MPRKTTAKRKSIELKLTKAELEHIRDLMSVMVAKDRQKTLSMLLAEHKNTSTQESRLWRKVEDCCKENGVAIGSKAPDYLVGVLNKPKFAMITLPSDDA